MVVHDLRVPVPEHQVIDVLRLRQVRHERVAIVVVARVFVVEERNVHVPLQRVRVLHVPVGHQLHAVGIGVHGEDDVILEDAHRLFVVAADQLVGRLDQLVGAKDLGGVKAAVEPHDGLALLGQRAGLGLGEPLALGELHRDVFVLLQELEILRRRDDRRELGPSFGRLAHLDYLHPVRLGVGLLPIRDELIVVGKEVVVTDVMAEKLLRRRNVTLGAGSCRTYYERQNGHAPRAESPHRHPEPPNQVGEAASGKTSNVRPAQRGRSTHLNGWGLGKA